MASRQSIVTRVAALYACLVSSAAAKTRSCESEEALLAHAPAALRRADVPRRSSFLLGTLDPGPYTEQSRQVTEAIARAFDLDPSCVRVFVLDAEPLRRLHEGLGGRVGYHFDLHGFQIAGMVFVRRSLGRIRDSVLVHEVLHALSQRFAADASRMDYDALVEGITQYFTEKVVTEQLHISGRVMLRSYGAYERFAAGLAARLGEPVLAEAYFKKGFGFLERAAEPKLGEGALRRGAAALARKDFPTALEIVSGE